MQTSVSFTSQARLAAPAGSTRPPRSPFTCQATLGSKREGAGSAMRHAGTALIAGLAAASLLSAGPSVAAVRLPPIDNDPDRCERAYVGNTIGQANAVSDKLLDLRLCKLSGADLSGKTLSGALMVDADLSKTNMVEVVMTKAYAVGANFSGANMTNAVVDRVDFDGADLSGVRFVNAVITGTTFEGANLADTTFEDALIGSEDAKRLCANPTLKGESRLEVGCRTDRS